MNGAVNGTVQSCVSMAGESVILSWVTFLMFLVQKDDLDGEIDLKSCVKVSEFDVEKNYGFQIQVSARFTGSLVYLWKVGG